MTSGYVVRQDTLLGLSDGNQPEAALLRMGIAPGATKWDLFALQGRMFQAHQATIGTAIAGSAADAGGIVLTAPSFRFSVPVGTTVFPRRFQWSFAAMAGTANEITVAYTQTNTYSSGGTAVTPVNWRTDNPLATVVTSCYVAAGSAITEGALVGARTLYQYQMPLAAAFATSYTLEKTLDVRWDTLHPIVGPASFLVWWSAATTASTAYFQVDWAEVPTVSAITAV